MDNSGLSHNRQRLIGCPAVQLMAITSRIARVSGISPPN
jgi:hypothetical protein